MKTYRFRVHTGPSFVAELAGRLLDQGVQVTSIGIEHVNFTITAPDAYAARVRAEGYALVATQRSSVELLGEAA